MTIERALPQLLEHVDIDRWQRPAAILRLLATLTPWPPGPVELGRADLQSMLERDDQQAKYDHRAMLQLASRDRVLIRWRGAGRRGDCWRINPDVRHWVNVPWIGRKSVVVVQVEAFLRASAGNPQPLWGERAGQSDRSGASTPQFGQTEPLGQWGIDHPTTVGHHPTTVHSERGIGDRPPHNGSAPGAPSQFGLEGKPSLPLAEGTEGEVAAPQSPEAERLVAAVQDAMGVRLWAGGLRGIAEIADTFPSRLSELLDAARTLRGLNSPKEAARVLRASMTVSAGSVVDQEKLAANLRRLIATCEGLEDHEGADRWRAKLNELAGI